MDTIYKEVTVSISMSKNFMVEVPEYATREELIDKAKEEIITPPQLIDIAKHLLKQLGVKVHGVEFEDWYVDELEYVAD